MNKSPSVCLDAINARGMGVRVMFEWLGDRYGHTIYRMEGEHASPLCSSVEGTPADSWPTSPPVQELVEHQLSSGQRSLLLTGQSGKSHWSVTVEGMDSGLCFDIAVRLKELPQQLGSTYEGFTQEPFATSITPSKETASATSVEQLSNPALQWIAPQLPLKLLLPTTVRWQYRIQA